jgi:putative ABC transport system permease protein
MDLASAQWVFNDLGRLNRIDLRLRPGTDAPAYRSLLASQLPAGVLAVSPQIETERAASATRAYRVNLNMLALVALLTGAFLVFSTQWLSVLRRRHELALLRAVGVTRAQLQQALIAEGAALGAAGSLLGLGLGFVGADWVLRYLAVDLTGERLFLPLPALAFFALGAAVACLGAWLPAREAARRSPALALKSGDAEAVLAHSPTIPGIVFLCAGGLLAVLPATHGLPLAGYASVASLLLGSVLLAPMLMRALLRRVPRSGRPDIDVAMAQLRGSAGLSAISLAAVIVSFSLMVAMSIMVYSFRDSFETWLERVLPADIQLRTQLGSTTVTFSPEDQRELATIGGVARATFQRSQPVYLSPKLAPVTLIARDDLGAANTLPLVSRLSSQPIDVPTAWVSESFEDIYGSMAGSWITVPLDGRPYRFLVAGVWRDYVRPGGAIVIERPRYIAITGDRAATEGALWLHKGANEATVNRTIHNRLQGRAVEIISTPELRIRSLAIFDRAFAMTYALEMIAVVIGLVGVGVAASTTALSRRAQFGVLRHLGMLRRQVLAMLASEGLVMSGIGVAYGLALGVLLSLVLIYVINRQSFNWSIDLSLPWLQLGAMSLALIAASALTSMCSGRAAMSMDVIRAAREDW